MKTITQKINVYTFDELSDTAKDVATSYLNNEHFWSVDSIASLETFAKYFGVKIKTWEYAAFGNAEITTDAKTANFRGFTLDNARAIPDYLTGYCLDYDLRETFIKSFEKSGDAKTAFIDAMDAGIRSARDDWEGQFDVDYMLDHCTANNYEFNEAGGLI